MEKPKRKKFRQETVIHSYITRPLSIEIIRLIWNSKITANQITIFRIILNIISLFLFLQATFLSILIGFILFQIHELLDSVDGMYARMKNQQSKIGVWMEQFFDTLFSDINGLMGITLCFSAYKITENYYYFIVLAFSITSVKIFNSYIKIFSLSKDRDGFEHKIYDNSSYLPIFGVGFLQGLKNLYITILTWQNQILLFAIVLLIPFYRNYNIDIFLYALIFVLIINQPPWIYAGYLSFKKVKND